MNTFDFGAFNQSGQWQPIWNNVFNLLRQSYNRDDIIRYFPNCLATLRILSREKSHLNQTITNEQIDCLLNIANIGQNNIETTATVSAEALKALCNLVFQSTKCQELCLTNATLEGIIKRLRTYREQNVDYDLQLFDMKLLFLITALNPDVRVKLRDDLHGLTYLVETLDMLIKKPKGDDGLPTTSNQALATEEVNLVVEILKVLFNVTVRNETSIATEEEEEGQFRRLAIVLHDLLLCRATSVDKHIELQSNAINLLTNLPTACYSELVVDATETTDDIHTYEANDVTALDVLLEFLATRLGNIDVSHRLPFTI